VQEAFCYFSGLTPQHQDADRYQKQENDGRDGREKHIFEERSKIKLFRFAWTKVIDAIYEIRSIRRHYQ